MSRRTLGRWLAAAALVGAVVLGVVAALDDPITGLWYLVYLLAGSVLVMRRPTNPVGWLLLLIMVGFMGTTDLTPDQVAAMESGTADPVTALLIWLGAMSGVCVFAGFGTLAMILPTGYLPAGRWRRPAIALLTVNAVLAAVTAIAPRISVTVDGGARTLFVPNPFAVAPESPIWAVLPDADIAFVPVLAILAIGVLSIVVRYVRAAGLLRLQLRWLVASLTFTVVAVCAGFVIILVGGEAVGWFAWLPATMAFLTIPLAIMVAVLRYRLLEIDRVISRTISWALATGVLAVIFLGAVASLQALLVDVTQGETVAVAASTLLTAAIFQPVRRRLQSAVDRRFGRAHADRDRILAAVGTRLRDEVDLEMIQGEILASASEVVRPTATAIWLRPRVTS